MGIAADDPAFLGLSMHCCVLLGCELTGGGSGSLPHNMPSAPRHPGYGEVGAAKCCIQGMVDGSADVMVMVGRIWQELTGLRHEAVVGKLLVSNHGSHKAVLEDTEDTGDVGGVGKKAEGGLLGRGRYGKAIVQHR